MDIDSTKLTVFFEAPFWIGVFERIERRKLSVCKVVFGAEPKDYEVWEYLLFQFKLMLLFCFALFTAKCFSHQLVFFSLHLQRLL